MKELVIYLYESRLNILLDIRHCFPLSVRMSGGDKMIVYPENASPELKENIDLLNTVMGSWDPSDEDYKSMIVLASNSREMVEGIVSILKRVV